MRIKNTIEDLVFNLTQSIVRDMPHVPQNSRFKLDIVCYVLNRIKPHYVVSSRGLAHKEQEFEQDKQVVTDIITTIYEAIHVISSRRKEVSAREDEILQWDYSYQEMPDFYCNFPQIIGKVADSATFEPLEGVSVLLCDASGKQVEMENTYWTNPYDTASKTSGIFTFWPKSRKAEDNSESTVKPFIFILKLYKNGWSREEKILQLSIRSEKMIYDHIRREDIYTVDTIFMAKI